MAESFERFVSLTEASNVSGVSRRAIGRWLDEDPAMKTEPGPRGGRLVWLADVIAKQRKWDDDDEDEEDEKLTPELAQARVFSEMAKALQLQNQHIERTHEPTSKLIGMLSEENVKLRTRIDELEKKIAEMLATHERHITEEWQRQREEQRERRAAARADEAIKTIVRFTPALLAGVAGHFNQRGAQEAILVDAVQGLSDDQFRAMITSGLFGPEAIALIERIRATGKQHASQAPNGPAANGAPHTQDTRAA